MTLTGAGNNLDSGLKTGGTTNVYVSPYTATVGTTTGVQVICDDYATGIYVGYNWTANSPITLTSSGISQLKFGLVTTLKNGATNASINATQAYEAAAWLGQQIAAIPNTSANAQTTADYQYALWSIFDSTDVSYTNLDVNAQSYYKTAMGNINDPLIRFSNVQFFTPQTHSGPVPPNSQEFMYVTPEPTTLLLFGSGLVLIGFVLRRRSVTRRNHALAA
jgi:hypothetical protein